MDIDSESLDQMFKLSKSFRLCVFGIEKKRTLGFTDVLYLKIHIFHQLLKT